MNHILVTLSIDYARIECNLEDCRKLWTKESKFLEHVNHLGSCKFDNPLISRKYNILKNKIFKLFNWSSNKKNNYIL